MKVVASRAIPCLKHHVLDERILREVAHDSLREVAHDSLALDVFAG